VEDLVAGLSRTYRGRSILVTGHTGFKGGWLTLWLSSLDANVTGYALGPPSSPCLFGAAGVESRCRSITGDVRDLSSLRAALAETRPTAVFHLAAQSLVRRSFAEPLKTIDTNVTGTATVLEAIRLEGRPCAVVVVTSDKCYEDRAWVWGYRENDTVGGRDPYSASKGAAEIVTAAYRSSFFPPDRLGDHGIAVATARAGNVIGGGDWAEDRIVPDAVRALGQGRPVSVRNPDAVRPWQHVLEPLGAYLLLGARLLGDGTTDPGLYCGPWNFGPPPESARPVAELVSALTREWGVGSWAGAPSPDGPRESARLLLSSEKAHHLLGWTARWDLAAAVRATVGWYRAHARGASPDELRALSLLQIERYAAGAGP
jgi:CDP-glucose 4,6-dehydratase